jgi:crotonobetainyl-CoA:carnitine CoA-transferase CaiB-like acyl-CoA transferase
MYVANNKKFEAFLVETGMAKWRDAGLAPKDLAQKFDEVMRTRTSQEWEDFCAEVGTEGVICHTSAEWLHHPQALQSKIIGEFTDPELGKFRGPGINARLSRTPGSVRAPRPKLDAHRDEILKELSSRQPSPPPAAAETLRSALQGVKVVDLCIVLAGPTCGRTLAEFGADVVKIDSPHVSQVLRHNDINRGKRSILIDLKTSEGLEIFWKLVDGADVVVQNFRNGVAERLGIGYEQVRTRRPDIIYGSMNTFGYLGPYAGRPGHEQIGQAVTGMQTRFGSNKPATGVFAANDYGTGLMACYGVALALLERRRTGKGQFVDSSLAYTATMLQSALMLDYEGKQWNEPHGQEALGSGPLNRLYQAADGWLFLSARKGELARCAELADIAGNDGEKLEQALEGRLRQRNVADWEGVLSKAGLGVHRVVPSLVELMNDALSKSRGLSVTRDHEGFGPITTTSPGIRMSATPPLIGRPAPKPGSDAASVLKDIGMDRELDRLVSEKVIALDGVKAGC